MPRALRLLTAAGLLLPLCAGAGRDTSLVGALDQLWGFVDRVQQSVARSVSDEVGDRLEAAQAALSDRLSALSGRLDAIETAAAVGGGSVRLPRDCSDLPAGTQSGVHLLQPGLTAAAPVPAFCDLQTDGGGWTVIQRRADIQPRQDFFLDWAAYKAGFGELDGEFWWGLDSIWATTAPRDRRYVLRVDLEDFDGARRHAVYQTFRVASEAENYRLLAVNYTGDAGDGLSYHSGEAFSTKDRDQDAHSTSHCAKQYKGAWWYKRCHNSNLNGQYLSGQHASGADGVNWEKWRGNNYSLKSVTMKIRPIRAPWPAGRRR